MNCFHHLLSITTCAASAWLDFKGQIDMMPVDADTINAAAAASAAAATATAAADSAPSNFVAQLDGAMVRRCRLNR